ncbi:MAG: hypothetical protein PHC39_04475 [Proteiniphilum sp.]|nr:hypothetical protein [Proteiniphilum sp.]
MRRLLILALVLLLAVGQVGAVRVTYQDWGKHSDLINYYPSVGYFQTYGFYPPGGILATRGTYSSLSRISLYTPKEFTYSAWDVYTHHGDGISLRDASNNEIYMIPGSTVATWGTGRFELKMVGSQAKTYVGGVLKATSPVLSVNPSNIHIYVSGDSLEAFDNILIAESDHHVVGSIPSNWSVVRDFTNPASTGVYAWNPSTSTWILKNSYIFYINADTDSTDSTYTENLIITNLQYGTIVNTTVIDSTVPFHQVAYDVNAFLNTPTALGTAIPDGEYSVCFQGSAVCENLWVISNGAAVTFDASSYSVDDTATVDYVISGGGYWDPATYTYKMIIQDIFGNVVSTQSITSQTGSKTYTFDSSDTNGVYYAIVIATPIAGGDENWLNYDSAELSSYITIEGYVNNAQTAIPINISYVNITQGSLINAMTTVDGNYSTTAGTAFLTGSSITINATSTGFKQYLYSFTPSTGSKKVINITLDPIAPTHTGLALNGIIRDTVYGRTISGVNVAITNATYGESYAVAANSVGYYLADESDGIYFTNGRCYSIAGTKTGYGATSAFKCLWGA